MKTEVVMKRELFGFEISQKSKSQMFSATDLVRAGNMFRMSKGLAAFNMQAWFKNQGTKEFIEELKEKYGEVKISGRGRGKHTWVHPLLFIDMALAISPKLKIEVYEWLFDHLIKERNASGNSYKEMCGYLYVRHGDKRSFQKYIAKVANQIKLKCKVDDWQKADEQQLEKRSKLHKEIALLADVLNNNDEAVRQAILRN
jgi:hypothetical protein